MARAPSVWFRYDDAFGGDILHQSILVPHEGDTVDTYYCCMQWNAGLEGGGYCGIQDHPKGRAFIYSIWDPKASKVPIKSAYKGLWTEVANCGGEGTGLRSLNFSIGWRPDNWYSLVTRVWDVNSHTHFGFWIHDEGRRHWTHVITMDFPVKDVAFNTSTGCFVEDWAKTGNHTRTAHYRHGFKRKMDGSWFPFSTGHFNIVQGSDTLNHRNNYDSGVKGDYYYLTTGGNSHHSSALGSSHTFHAITPAHPTEPPLDFHITSAKPNMVSWNVPDSSTPQFKYNIYVGGHRVASGTQPEVRSHALNGARVGERVEVKLEDILGNVVLKTTRIIQ